LIEAKPDFPCVTISPQCAAGSRWNAAELAKLVDFTANNLRIDRQRLYLTGLSMGGSGTWSLLAEHPSLFAAAVPICGRGDLTQLDKIAKTPVWVTVGGKDSEKTVTGNEEIVAALKKSGAQVEFTLYPDLEHDCWTATYENPKVWEWLLSHKKPD
jgi:predicted peptidase